MTTPVRIPSVADVHSIVDAAVANIAPPGDVVTADQLTAGLAGRLPTSVRGAAGGVASLDAGGVIPSAQLPPLAITKTTPVADQATMLALVAEPGDVAIRADGAGTFILRTEPATVLDNWSAIAPPLGVSSVDGRTGVVDLSDRYLPLGARGTAGGVAALDVAGKVPAAQLPAAGASDLWGHYAARPAPGTVSTGSRFYADDTREEYVARGDAGQPATSWWAPPSNGGCEIGYAKLTGTTWTVPAGSAWMVVPGCFFGIRMPERPIYLSGTATIRYVTATSDPVFGIFETSDGVITQLAEAHPGQQSNSFDIASADAVARLSGVPGVWRSFEFRVLQRAAAYTLYTSTVFPAQFRGVLG